MNSFNELALSPEIQRAIDELGYTEASPIQEKTLPILLGQPTDFVGLAATGTGKTAAFGIPSLEQIDSTLKRVQVLIMCPTRELAVQVADQMSVLGKYKGIRVQVIYGGSDYSSQIQGLRSGAQVVVGTPGRLFDHLKRGTLKLDSVQTVILDEADEMFSMGFKDELEAVMNATASELRKIWLFSATMSGEVRRVADTFLKSPRFVQVNRSKMLSSTVEQVFYRMRESDKPEILCRIIESDDDFYGLVFCQTKATVIDLTQYLSERGLKVDCLHGDKDQRARERSIQLFRERKVSLLVCTDVASRGLDVKDVTHVINYSIPREAEAYVHRIGRTARAGKSGVAMSLVTPSHFRLIAGLERLTKSKIKEGRLPSRREVAALRVSKFLQRFQEQDSYGRAVDLLGEEWKLALAGMTHEEVAGRFLSLMYSDLFSDRPPAKPLLRLSESDTNERGSKRDQRFSQSGRERGGGRMQRRRSANRPGGRPAKMGRYRTSPQQA